MSKDAKNVPALRFKGYSDAWEKRKLREITEINPKGKIPEVFRYVDLESVKNSSIISSKIETKQTTPSRAQRTAEIGDVFYQTVRPYQKNNVIFLLHSSMPYVFSTGYAQLRSNMNSFFILYLVQTDGFVNDVLNRATGTSYPAINPTHLATIIVCFPKIVSEQNRIGQVLEHLDNLITATQDKLSFLKKMKMFFLQQIFPTKDHDVPQIRFDGFTDAWSHYKLGSLMRIDKEQEVKKELLTDIQKGFYVLAMRTFSMDGYIDHSKPYWLNCLDNVSDDKFLLPREFAILDADMDANLPKIGRVLLNASSEKYLLAAHVRKIQVKSGNDPIFIYALMRGNSVHERLKLEANGSISKRLLDKNVYKQSILVPNRSEQSKIGRLFFLLETTITLHQQKIQMLKQVKKSCLQNLFI